MNMTTPKTSPVAESVVELKPCPNLWCAHNQPDIIQWGRAGLWRVQCDCGIYPGDSSSEAEAVKLWNTRTIEDDTPTDAGEGVEPVAWMYQYRLNFRDNDDDWSGDRVTTGKLPENDPDFRNIRPLYAHPTPTDTGLVATYMVAIEELAKIISYETPDDLTPTEVDDQRYRAATPIFAALGMTIGGGDGPNEPIGWGFDWPTELANTERDARTALSKAKDLPHG